MCVPVISLRVPRHQFARDSSSVFVGEEGRRLVTVLADAAEVADRVRGRQTVLDVLTARHAGDFSVGTLAVVSTSGDSSLSGFLTSCQPSRGTLQDREIKRRKWGWGRRV